MRPVKVVHVITKLELGGAQQVALDILSGLDRGLFSPALVAGAEGYLMERARGLGFPVRVAPDLVREISPRRDLDAFGQIRSILKGMGGVDLVHTHSSKAGILGRWAAHRAGVPAIVHTIHGHGITPGQPALLRAVLKMAERLTSRVTTRLVAVSEATRRQGLSWGLYRPEQCVVIACGFDLAAIRDARPVREELETDFGIPRTAPLLLMAACLKPQKAPLDFARVAHLVARKRPDAHFMLAGDGELRGDLEKEVRRLDLGGRFHLLGWREDVFALMRSADAVVLTSLWEGLPLVVPQAHAAGRPVVATAVDGTPEAIREGVDGFLCPPGDVECLADRVDRILMDAEAARRMGMEGVRSSRRFSLGDMVRAYENLYLELVGRPRPTPAPEGSAAGGAS